MLRSFENLSERSGKEILDACCFKTVARQLVYLAVQLVKYELS